MARWLTIISVEKITGRGCRLTLPLDLTGEISDEPQGVEETARSLAVIIRDNLASYWTQLQAVHQTVTDYAAEFRGDDPLSMAQLSGAWGEYKDAEQQASD